MTFEAERALALRVATQAGAIVLERWGRLTADDVDYKGLRDPVTEVDLASEAFIAAALRAAFPDDGILGEEHTRHATDARRVWIVDPLDGTVNYTRGHHFVAVSIGLICDGLPAAAAVCAPALGETWSASAGGGCWRHRARGAAPERCCVSAVEQPLEAIGATGFPYVRDSCPFDNLEPFNRMFRELRGLRRCGTASIDLALVASGVYDLFWEPHLAAHDVAAGALLIREAGGRVSDYRGGDDWLFGKNIVATNGALHDFTCARMVQDFDADARRAT